MTVALRAATFATPGRVAPLPRRPRQVGIGTAARVRTAAVRDRSLLPRRQRPGVTCAPEAGAHLGLVAWQSRDHWLRVVVPIVLGLDRSRAVLRRLEVAPATFRRYLEGKSLYADHATGRGVIVRPDVLAGLVELSPGHVKKCNRAARELGLEVVVCRGRMLTWRERCTARRRGSHQRGLSTISAFAVPGAARLVLVADTPPRGALVNPSGANCGAFGQRSAGHKRPSLRSGPLEEKQDRARRRPPDPPGPALDLAYRLADRVPWLYRCPAGRIARQLTRFVDPTRCGGTPWTTQQLVDAMTAVNTRLGYGAPARTKRPPWGLLAWYLAQVDELADHPNAGRLVGTPWCGECTADGFRWLEDPQTRRPVTPCPTCSPQAREGQRPRSTMT